MKLKKNVNKNITTRTMELNIELQDDQWQLKYIDHNRNIARAIVYDDNGKFYFVRAERNDDFGQATLIETAGGGVEEAVREYEYRANTRLGKLIANRELKFERSEQVNE